MLREVPIIVVSALIVAVIIKTFFVHFFYVPSGSMQNTLGIGDRIAVNKFSAMFSDIRRGEVVVFKDPAGWLGAAPAPTGDVFTRDLKRALVDVGVMPDPASQTHYWCWWRSHSLLRCKRSFAGKWNFDQ